MKSISIAAIPIIMFISSVSSASLPAVASQIIIPAISEDRWGCPIRPRTCPDYISSIAVNHTRFCASQIVVDIELSYWKDICGFITIKQVHRGGNYLKNGNATTADNASKFKVKFHSMCHRQMYKEKWIRSAEFCMATEQAQLDRDQLINFDESILLVGQACDLSACEATTGQTIDTATVFHGPIHE